MSATPSSSGLKSEGGKPAPVVVKAKRGARACTQCRKLKKTCEGGEAPCVRCRSSGATCVFDSKPTAAFPVDADGGNRLAGIETTLANNERRLDTLVGQMGEISNVLSEVLVRLRSTGTNSAPLLSPGAAVPYSSAPAPPLPFSAFDSTASTSSPSTSLPSFGHQPPSSASPAFQPLPSVPMFPTPPSTSAAPSSLPRPHTFEPPRRSSAPNPHVPSGLDALASLASSSSREIHRFASRMAQPISALSDAIAQLDDEAAVKPEVVSPNAVGEDDDEVQVSSRAREDGTTSGQPPTKKSRVNAPAASPSPDHLDLVAKELVTDKDARELVALWMKECQGFCSVLDPAYDSYESLRKRSAFLFNVVLYTALRARGRNAPPSKELLAAAEETRRFARDQVFRTPALEDVQAVFIMACYHQEPYILSGMGLRLALAARFETTWEQIVVHGETKMDEKARRLTAQLRCFLYVLQLDFKHSRYSGRQILVQQNDLDLIVSQADRLLTLPFAIFSDIRHVANFRLVWIERSILSETESSTGTLAESIAYINKKRQVLQEWHTHYDSIIAGFQPSPLAWPRRSHLRMFHDANLFLHANTFKKSLLEGSSTMSAELDQVAAQGLHHAFANLQTVLGSPIYREGVAFSGYLLRVDLSFAAFFLLTSAAAFPHHVKRDEVAEVVQQLAELLSTIAGSQRYSQMISAARDQYLARTEPAVAPTANPSSYTAAQASPSLRAILAPTLPTLSQPMTPFAAADYSSFPAPGAPSSAATAAFTTSPFSLGGSNAFLGGHGAGGTGTAALLPGEMEIDWSAQLPPSLFDDPAVLLNHDWTATVGGGLTSWLDGL